jgi:2-amino-4-hydroxy-6-hydroxymethyldihydropteridine diphosphokinase
VGRDSQGTNRYFIALGSNLGDREATLKQAWSMLASLCERARLSRIYETRPMYVADQPLYLNAVGEAASPAKPSEMLASLHRIEHSLGRDRSREIRMGPRPIDLDILLCDAIIMDAPELTIPHPRITERMFVLVPLLELAPDLRDPRTGTPYSRARATLRGAEGAPGAGDAASSRWGVYLYSPR